MPDLLADDYVISVIISHYDRTDVSDPDPFVYIYMITANPNRTQWIR